MNRLKKRRAVTIVELMIASFIAFVVGLSIISGIMYGMLAQQAVRERNGASRAAAAAIESTKRSLFGTLQGRTFTTTIDDRGTAETSDDVQGTVNLQLFTEDGTEVGVAGVPIPLDLSMLVVRATVTWNPAGRPNANDQTLTISTLLAP